MAFIRNFGMAVVAIVALAQPAALLAASGRNFTVNNTNSSVSIQRVWTVESSTTNTWLESTLNAPIKPNANSNFTFPDGDICFYDIKVQFSDGYVQTFQNVNVCRNGSVRAT